MKYFLFPDNDFGTTAFLFGQSCLCVTFTLWSTPSFGMLLSNLSNRNTRVCISSIRMISFFFTLQCELFTSCNVTNNLTVLCLHRQGEGGRGEGGGGWLTKREQVEEVPKIPKFEWTSFMDDPLQYLIKTYKL